MFTSSVIFASIVSFFIGYCLCSCIKELGNKSKNTNEENKFTKQMKAEYERGCNVRQEDLNRSLNEITRLRKENLAIKSDLEVSKTERDQYAHQVEDLVDHGNTIRNKILSEIEEFVESKKAKLSNQIQEPSFKVTAIGSYTNPKKVENLVKSQPIEGTYVSINPGSGTLCPPSGYFYEE